MRKKLLTVLTTAVFVLMVNCQTSKNNDQHKIETIIVNPFSAEKIKLSDIADTVEYIPLETIKGHTIGMVKKIFFINNRFYVIDYFIKNSIYCFNAKGKFIFEINNIGKGPGEYNFLTDVALSYNKESLALADCTQGKLLFYDFNGTYKNEQKIASNLYFENFYMHKNYNVLLAQSYLLKDAPEKKPSIDYADKHIKSYNYIIASNNFSDTYIGFKGLNLYTERMSLLKPFDFFNDTIYSTYAYNDTIFTINRKEMHPEYFVDFGSHRIPEKYTKAKNYEVYSKLYNDADLKWAGIIDRLVITKNFIGFIYATAIENENSSLYLKSTKRTVNFGQIENDINNGPLGIIAGKYSDNILIAFIHAYNFLEKFDKSNNPEITNLIKSTNENDNPVIVLITLKK